MVRNRFRRRPPERDGQAAEKACPSAFIRRRIPPGQRGRSCPQLARSQGNEGLRNEHLPDGPDILGEDRSDAEQARNGHIEFQLDNLELPPPPAQHQEYDKVRAASECEVVRQGIEELLTRRSYLKRRVSSSSSSGFTSRPAVSHSTGVAGSPSKDVYECGVVMNPRIDVGCMSSSKAPTSDVM